MTANNRWRAILRRLRIGGEARWMPDPIERETHRATVRRRLARKDADPPAATGEDEPPATER